MREILDKLLKLSKRNETKTSFVFLTFFLILFLSINIYFTQNISPLFFGVISYDKKSSIQFLKKIRNRNCFNQQLNYLTSVNNNLLKEEVFAEELQRKAKIKEFEQILEKNSQSRDILYSLFQLYSEENDLKKANSYFKQAVNIDPDISN